MQIPKGGLIGKTIHTVRYVRSLKISLYAANACYFLVLSVFPALLLLLGLLRYTPLEVERLGEMLRGLLPEALWEGAEELILLTYDNATNGAVGLSALTALWSASRGIYGMMTGLNAIYEVEENRGYFRTRLLCAGYTVAFLLVLVVTLGLHVFGTGVLSLLERAPHLPVRMLVTLVDFRFVLLVVLQTVFFAAMFTALPNGENRFCRNLPGAMLACWGWLLFSNLYSIYVEHFARLSNVYGSVYAVALSMLWLYCCVSIVFYGGALNAVLARQNRE